MARKRLTREESRTQTRHRLLEAARTVFARRGFHGASVDEIAAEAGYSKGAVYSNFEGKEEIFLELDRAYMAEEVAKIDAVLTGLEARKASPDQAGEGIGAWVKSFTADPEWFVLGVELQLHARRNPAFAVKAAAMKDHYRGVFASLIRRMFEALGKESPANSDQIANVMIALSLGIPLIQSADRKALKMGELMLATMNAFMAATPEAKRKR